MIVAQSFASEANEGQLIEATKSVTYGTQLDLEKAASSSCPDSEDVREHGPAQALWLQRTLTLPFTSEKLEIDKRLQIERTKSKGILRARTADGTILPN